MFGSSSTCGLVHLDVTSPVRSRLKIAAIDYLNPAPLMWDFEHGAKQEQLAERYAIHATLPAQCAVELAAGRADIGLIPATAYATTPDLVVIPGCAIASLDAVRSILLVVRSGRALSQVRRVAMDPSSRSSNLYAQIVLRKFFQAEPEFVQRNKQPSHHATTAIDLCALLQDCDAAVLIGDPALRLHVSGVREIPETGEPIQCMDLAQVWHAHTGLPWVSAFWAVRPDAIEAAGQTPDQIRADFLHSRDAGLGHIEEIVAEWAPRFADAPAVAAQEIHSYLCDNIHYVLDAACMAGLECFYRYAAEMRLLPVVESLRFL